MWLFCYNSEMTKQTETIGIEKTLLDEIINLAKEYGLSKVVLFGSRARDDYRKKSDIDLAVSGGNLIEFMIDIDEKINTLLKFDIVNLDGFVQADLIKSINSEGKILYEKI